MKPGNCRYKDRIRELDIKSKYLKALLDFLYEIELLTLSCFMNFPIFILLSHNWYRW